MSSAVSAFFSCCCFRSDADASEKSSVPGDLVSLSPSPAADSAADDAMPKEEKPVFLVLVVESATSRDDDIGPKLLHRRVLDEKAADAKPNEEVAIFLDDIDNAIKETAKALDQGGKEDRFDNTITIPSILAAVSSQLLVLPFYCCCV